MSPRLLTLLIFILGAGPIAIGVFYIVRRLTLRRSAAVATNGTLTWITEDGRKFERRLPSTIRDSNTAYVVYHRSQDPSTIVILRTAENPGCPVSVAGIAMIVTGVLILLCHYVRVAT